MAESRETDEVDWPPHLDALTAAPRNHRLLWKDAQIRVLEVTVVPGEREKLHHHQWSSIMIVLSRPNYVNYDAGGNEIKPAVTLPANATFPIAARLPPQRPHCVEVLAGEAQALHAIRVEFKTPEAEQQTDNLRPARADSLGETDDTRSR